MTALARRLAGHRWARLGANRVKRLVQRVTASGREGPELRVFVAGVQRSGTNMLMGALDRSLASDVYHESDNRAFAGYEMREPEVVADLIRRSPAPVFVIKALCELQHLPALMDRFAPARTVWIYRDFRDVTNSMMASFKSVPATVRRIAEEGAAVGWWGEGMSDDTRAFLRAAVARDPDAHTSAALLWYLRNRLFFELGLDRDQRVLLIRYEDLVTEPPRVLREVAAFAGIPYSTRLGRGIHPRSIGRRPEPAMDPQVRAACEGLMADFEAARAGSGQPVREATRI